jgi:serine/threonine protein phosphatase PrpC
MCIADCLTRTFRNVDESYHKEFPDFAYNCGATACVILIVGNRIFSANVGDSRAVLSRNNKAVNLTHDHKTVNILEF